MKIQFVLSLVLLAVTPTLFAQESKGAVMTSTYTIRLKNNSDSILPIRVKRVAAGADCNQNTEESTSVLGKDEVMVLNCSESENASYCVDYPGRRKYPDISTWLQLDCATHFNSILELNLFGR